jgi:S-adenosyl-L-methionine hydrolase (adenosine-forming)
MPLITLTTDFGDADPFAGVMKGVILGIAPRARIVDLTHQIPTFEIQEAAFVLVQAYRYFPKKTVHVVVVDPGVGSARRPILVEAAGQYFVGPDNGVLSMVYGREKSRVRHITNAKYFLNPVSATFHGRDIFAPAAAHLAKGVRPAQFGPAIDDYLRPPSERPVQNGKRSWAGTVLKVDRFGNLITSFHIDQFSAVRERPFVMIAGVRTVERLAGHYAEAEAREPVVVVGSSGYLEVCVNQAHAAKLLGCAAGTPIELSIY